MNASERTQARARLSDGRSDAAVYQMVRRALATGRQGGLVVDVGCGRGRLRAELGGLFDRYVGVDVVAYPPAAGPIRRILADLEGGLPLAGGVADAAIAVETIEHLENPRALVRELARILKPGGMAIVTTPNQLSALSLLSLIAQRRFAAFQDVHYPAHRTALLEIDLRRIVAEAGLVEPSVRFSEHSRVPLTAIAYPKWASRRLPRLLSDNVLILARKPAFHPRH